MRTLPLPHSAPYPIHWKHVWPTRLILIHTTSLTQYTYKFILLYVMLGGTHFRPFQMISKLLFYLLFGCVTSHNSATGAPLLGDHGCRRTSRMKPTETKRNGCLFPSHHTHTTHMNKTNFHIVVRLLGESPHEHIILVCIHPHRMSVRHGSRHSSCTTHIAWNTAGLLQYPTTISRRCRTKKTKIRTTFLFTIYSTHTKKKKMREQRINS